jgi:hypothetical protein
MNLITLSHNTGAHAYESPAREPDTERYTGRWGTQLRLTTFSLALMPAGARGNCRRAGYSACTIESPAIIRHL